jgi:transcription elongation factor GreA
MRIPTRKKELERMANEDVDLHVTQGKFERMQRDLADLLQRQRPEAVAEVRRTGEMGDFSENAGYQIAKGTLRRINTRIEVLQDRIARAVIIPDGPSSMVRIGSVVTVLMNDKEFTYHILGSQESNPSRGTISHNSPIGKALLGARVGDTVNVTLPDRVIAYTVRNIA